MTWEDAFRTALEYARATGNKYYVRSYSYKLFIGKPRKVYHYQVYITPKRSN